MSKTYSVQKELFIQFTPSLARLCGVKAAIVLQRLSFLLNLPDSGMERDGHHWIWNTYEQWQSKHFPFWSVATIKRIFDQLETMHAVESAQFDGYASRKKYYRINAGMLEKLTMETADQIPIGSNCDDGASISSNCDVPSAQIDTMERLNLIRSLTENTTENTTEKTSESAQKAKKAAPKQASLLPLTISELVPEEFRTPAFFDAWEGFLAMRKANKWPMTERAMKAIAADLVKWGPSWAISALDKATRSNWRDVYAPDNLPAPKAPPRAAQEAAARFPEFLAGHPNLKYPKAYPTWASTEQAQNVRSEFFRWTKTGQYDKT